MSEVLSARAAAEVCGVDERTIRRWVKSGHLAADKRGGRFLIDRDALEPFLGLDSGQPNGHAAAERTERTERTVDAASLNLELVRLVDKLQEENRVMAGRIGWLEAQVEHLRALPQPELTERPLNGDSERSSSEPTPIPSAGLFSRLWQALRGQPAT